MKIIVDGVGYRLKDKFKEKAIFDCLMANIIQ
jgi:hypothetical protein